MNNLYQILMTKAHKPIKKIFFKSNFSEFIKYTTKNIIF